MHTLSLSFSLSIEFSSRSLAIDYGYPLRYIYVFVFGFIRGVGFMGGGANELLPKYDKRLGQIIFLQWYFVTFC